MIASDRPRLMWIRLVWGSHLTEARRWSLRAVSPATARVAAKQAGPRRADTRREETVAWGLRAAAQEHEVEDGRNHRGQRFWSLMLATSACSIEIHSRISRLQRDVRIPVKSVAPI
jgi:hypothetical protein